MSESLDNLTLGQLFSTGQKILTEIDNSSLSSVDPQYQAKVNQAIQRLGRADDLTAKLNLFSDNEIIDDINTNDLKFLLIPSYMGQLTLKLTSDNRASVLEKAKVKKKRNLF
jgi:hypothetical protein